MGTRELIVFPVLCLFSVVLRALYVGAASLTLTHLSPLPKLAANPPLSTFYRYFSIPLLPSGK
jgi:hypothetical protein